MFSLSEEKEGGESGFEAGSLSNTPISGCSSYKRGKEEGIILW